MNPYLFFNGDCEAAFERYAEILDGEITAMLRHRGTPAEDSVPPEWRDKIMHACMRIGDRQLMASDCPPEYYAKPAGYYVQLPFTDRAAAERVFQALAEGGTVHMALEKTFWAEAFGMLTDRFGTPWMINCDPAAG